MFITYKKRLLSHPQHLTHASQIAWCKRSLKVLFLIHVQFLCILRTVYHYERIMTKFRKLDLETCSCKDVCVSLRSPMVIICVKSSMDIHLIKHSHTEQYIS
jgi:hypothetical protein